MNTKLKRSWRCDVCGYMHIGPDVPHTCPKCGVGAEEFYVVDTIAPSISEEEMARIDALAKQEAGE